MMLRTFKNLAQDEAGVIISAELILVATILVIGLVVGLSELQHSIVAELNDIGDGIGSINQSFSYTGFSKTKDNMNGSRVAAFSAGSAFYDEMDECDDDQCDIACDAPTPEGPKDFD